MTRREQIILSVTLVIMLLLTILPPVTVTSYDHSGGVTKASPVIRYEFLFTKSLLQINYQRLLLQYLIVLVISRWLVLHQRKISASFATRVSELSVTNDKLLEVINRGRYAGEQLKQRATELSAEKQRLSDHITQLKASEQKWHTSHNQLEQNMNQRVSDLCRANEQLQKQIAERRHLEQQLESQTNELNAVCERLRQQTAKLMEAEECFRKQSDELAAVKNAEQQLHEYNQQLQKRVEERTAELGAANKQLEKQLIERVQAEEFSETSLDKGDERPRSSERRSEIFNINEMKALAELAKRLSQKQKPA